MGETETEMYLLRNYLEKTVEPTFLWHDTVSKGVWHRFALTVKFSNDPSVGFIQLHGDLSGGSGDPTFTELMAPTYMATAYPSGVDSPRDYCDLSIGPYWTPPPFAMYRDYANIQVVENWTP
jgi:hypothetical protein